MYIATLTPSTSGTYLVDHPSSWQVMQELPESALTIEHREELRIGLTRANLTVPSSRKTAFLHRQIRAFETLSPLRQRGIYRALPSVSTHCHRAAGADEGVVGELVAPLRLQLDRGFHLLVQLSAGNLGVDGIPGA
jgi:hypothetical protein